MRQVNRLALCITPQYENIQGTPESLMMADDVVVTVRVPKTLVQRARQVADSRDETMSQVIRRSLRGYVGRAPKSIENEDAA